MDFTEATSKVLTTEQEITIANDIDIANSINEINTIDLNNIDIHNTFEDYVLFENNDSIASTVDNKETDYKTMSVIENRRLIAACKPQKFLLNDLKSVANIKNSIRVKDNNILTVDPIVNFMAKRKQDDPNFVLNKRRKSISRVFAWERDQARCIAIHNRQFRQIDVYYFNSDLELTMYKKYSDVNGKTLLYNTEIKERKNRLNIEICCCWFRRAYLTKRLIDENLLKSINFVKKTHACEVHNCTCCCRPNPLFRDVFKKSFITERSNVWFKNVIASLGAVNTVSVIEKALLDVHKVATNNIVSDNKKYKSMNIKLNDEYFQIAQDGHVALHLKSQHDGDLENKKNDLNERVCCWYKREEFLDKLREYPIHSNTLKFIKTPHLCFYNQCKCCCKPIYKKSSLNGSSLCMPMRHTTDAGAKTMTIVINPNKLQIVPSSSCVKISSSMSNVSKMYPPAKKKILKKSSATAVATKPVINTSENKIMNKTEMCIDLTLEIPPETVPKNIFAVDEHKTSITSNLEDTPLVATVSDNTDDIEYQPPTKRKPKRPCILEPQPKKVYSIPDMLTYPVKGYNQITTPWLYHWKIPKPDGSFPVNDALKSLLKANIPDTTPSNEIITAVYSHKQSKGPKTAVVNTSTVVSTTYAAQTSIPLSVAGVSSWPGIIGPQINPNYVSVVPPTSTPLLMSMLCTDGIPSLNPTFQTVVQPAPMKQVTTANNFTVAASSSISPSVPPPLAIISSDCGQSSSSTTSIDPTPSMPNNVLYTDSIVNFNPTFQTVAQPALINQAYITNNFTSMASSSITPSVPPLSMARISSYRGTSSSLTTSEVQPSVPKKPKIKTSDIVKHKKKLVKSTDPAIANTSSAKGDDVLMPRVKSPTIEILKILQSIRFVNIPGEKLTAQLNVPLNSLSTSALTILNSVMVMVQHKLKIAGLKNGNVHFDLHKMADNIALNNIMTKSKNKESIYDGMTKPQNLNSQLSTLTTLRKMRYVESFNSFESKIALKSNKSKFQLNQNIGSMPVSNNSNAPLNISHKGKGVGKSKYKSTIIN